MSDVVSRENVERGGGTLDSSEERQLFRRWLKTTSLGLMRDLV